MNHLDKDYHSSSSEEFKARRGPLQDLDRSESSSSQYYIFEDDNNSESMVLLPPSDGGIYSMLALRYRNLESGDEEESDSSATDIVPIHGHHNKAPMALVEASPRTKGRELGRRIIAEASQSAILDKERAPSPTKSMLGRVASSSRKRIFGNSSNNKSQVTSRSAVDERNDHFDDWEVEAAPRSLLSSASRSFRLSDTRSKSTPTEEEEKGLAALSRALPPLSSRSVTSSVVASIMKEQRKREKVTARNAAAVCQDGLECRWTADTVATALSLGEDAQGLLDSLRGRSGAVQMEEPYGFDALPYLHVADDVWIPHYEEYVVRTVDAFGRFLGKSAPIKTIMEE